MTKAEFFAQLEQAITHLPKDTREDILRYFTEQFEDLTEEGMTEAEAVAALGDFREAFDSLQADTSAPQNEGTPETAAHTEHRIFTAEHLPPRIRLTEKNCGVEILPSPDGRLWVEYDITRFTEVTVSCDANCFTYTAREIPRFFCIQFQRRKPTRLYLPQGYRPTMEIQTSNAPVRAADISCADALFHTQNSSILLTNLTADDLTVKTCNSPAKAEHITAKKLTVKTANASLRAAYLTAGEMQLNTTNGSLAAEHITADSLDASTANGKIIAEHLTVPTVTLTTSNGKISLENADVQHVNLSTFNAGIHAILPGTAADYGISTVTSTAIHSLRSAGAARSLNAKTFNGKLDITFVGEQ